MRDCIGECCFDASMLKFPILFDLERRLSREFVVLVWRNNNTATKSIYILIKIFEVQFRQINSYSLEYYYFIYFLEIN